MPVYEYKCKKCGHVSQIEHSMSDIGKLALKCKKCDSKRLNRIFSKFSVGKGDILSPKSLKEHGFTKLKKVDKGKYLKQD